MMLFKRQAFFQAFGVLLYCLLIGLFMGNANQILGNLGLPFGPVLILLLLSASVLICAVIVLYKPYKLFFIGNKKREALETVISTAVWLAVFLVIFIVLVAIFK